MGNAGEEIRIRPMEKKDAFKVYRIEKECFSDPWAESVFENFQNEKNQFFFVVEEKDILGYGTVMTVLDECEILRVAVDKSARRKGIGYNLLKEMTEFAKARGAKLFYLEVRESNKAALGMYEKYGFLESGRRKGYYCSPKEDAILMSLITEV